MKLYIYILKRQRLYLTIKYITNIMYGYHCDELYIFSDISEPTLHSMIMNMIIRSSKTESVPWFVMPCLPVSPGQQPFTLSIYCGIFSPKKLQKTSHRLPVFILPFALRSLSCYNRPRYFEREREIKFIGLFEDRGHRDPYSPYKPFNHNVYIGMIIFPHIDNPQSTGYN